jgi:hypothetical protein
MNKLKSLTQAITGILVWTLIVFFTYAFAQTLKITGVLQLIDAVYTSNVSAFWVLLVISRAAYSAISIIAIIKAVEFFERTGFFWFEENEHYRSRKETKDKSDLIVGYAALVVFFTLLAEVLIRLFTLPNQLPYLP